MNNENRGMVLGAIGVLIFSLTLPFTRMAVAELDPVFVALGRAVVAALLAALLLRWGKSRFPSAQERKSLLIIASGVIVGFPLCTSIAMRYVPASHGALLIGILPLATAVFATVRFHERPSLGFWWMAALGTALVVGFALFQGGGSFQLADLALFVAVLLAAMGYAEGGRLSQSMGGQQVICWALVLSLPVLLPIVCWSVWQHGLHAGPKSWLGFAYVSVFSMFIGFFFWYKGLAAGGIARVGQVQLIQPFLSLFGAAALLGESLTVSNIVFALVVLLVVGLGRNMKIQRQMPEKSLSSQIKSIASPDLGV